MNVPANEALAGLAELAARLAVYHEAAAYYVPHYADEVAAAWADVQELLGGLAEAEMRRRTAGNQLALFAAEGARS